MKLVSDNTKAPCNLCTLQQSLCKCHCSFCLKHKRDVPGAVLIGDSEALICKLCITESRELVKGPKL